MPPEVTPQPDPITFWETSLEWQMRASRVYGAPDICERRRRRAGNRDPVYRGRSDAVYELACSRGSDFERLLNLEAIQATCWPTKAARF